METGHLATLAVAPLEKINTCAACTALIECLPLSAFIFRHFDVIDGWFQDQREKDALLQIMYVFQELFFRQFRALRAGSSNLEVPGII